MAHRIKLTFAEPSRQALTGRSVFRLQVTASEASGDDLDNYIFLYQRSMVDPLTEVQCDEFMSICSAFDIVSYPRNTPNEEQSPQFFRKNTMDILLPSVLVVDQTISSIKSQVDVLMAALDAIENISDTEVYWSPDSEDSE